MFQRQSNPVFPTNQVSLGFSQGFFVHELWELAYKSERIKKRINPKAWGIFILGIKFS
jgi:hypothetical protein